MTLAVFDASVVVKWYVADDPFFEESLRARRAHAVAAPELILTEVANALWKYVRRGLVSLDDACDGVEVLRGVMALTPDRDLLGPAQRLAARLDHPVYDCVYLALAQRLAVPLVTADRRLAGKGAELGVQIEFIGSEA